MMRLRIGGATLSDNVLVIALAAVALVAGLSLLLWDTLRRRRVRRQRRRDR